MHNSDLSESLDTLLHLAQRYELFNLNGDPNADKLQMIADQTARLERSIKESQSRIDDEAKKVSLYRNCRAGLIRLVYEAMHKEKVTFISTGSAVFEIVENGGEQPTHVDLSNVPESFLERVPDLDHIDYELRAGRKLDFAELLPRGTHLEIRRKP
jgi:hypothetical protein